jgi:hypothetical protein
VTDERDPLPPREWQPTSHEWARRQAREAAAAAVRAARERRTTATARPTNGQPAGQQED